MPPRDLQPLQIVPDTRRQRRRTVKRALAFLLTVTIASVFALTLLAGDRLDDTPGRVLLIGSGLLTAVAVGAWVSFGVRRARKRARRQRWQMSAF